MTPLMIVYNCGGEKDCQEKQDTIMIAYVIASAQCSQEHERGTKEYEKCVTEKMREILGIEQENE